jgi:PncC family amidohydrolase
MDASINLGNLLRQKGWTISTAESCTGGFIAHLITLSPGASDYFPGSVVSYCDRVKNEVLGVNADDLARFTAVS